MRHNAGLVALAIQELESKRKGKPMSIYESICRNPGCQRVYTVKETEGDDGYCSFECWEQANCKDPEDKGDILEVRVEEITKNN
jgi:D-hexose-6-phosphate mutarotase